MAGKHLNMQKKATPVTELDAEERVGTFAEVCCGYTLDEALNEAQRCLGCPNEPCVACCPVGVDIPGFLLQLAEGDVAGAYASVRRTNALPAICGRVCPQETQCQGACTRGRNGHPVAIGLLERFVADWALEHAVEADAACALSVPDGHAGRLSGKRVAAIGSGPASLTCAAELLAAGADVTVFEALHEAGGVLVYGIPEFRLPNALVERELAQLEAGGAHIVLDSVIGKLYTLDELRGELGFDAVFIGSGAGLPRYLGIDGEALNGVCVANELLTRVNLMHGHEFPHYGTPVFAGKRCIVVGGGNVAMDAARTARRLGSEVTVLYRRTEDEMPARAAERLHAKQEGIEFLTLASPLAALGDEDGWVRALRCQRMKLEGVDGSGRPRPVPIEGGEFTVECDMLVVAVGSKTNPLLAQTTPQLQTDGNGLIVVDAATQMTSTEGVFAGGDATTGAATVILAMGAGKKAAAGIADYLTR